ncbi:MAG: tetratricopeptide repeat protein [Verrucomicrobia subdivision 3 bacterium]|nr:tetratricopeptide repeat protein [Limisphaerales bacterium]
MRRTFIGMILAQILGALALAADPSPEVLALKAHAYELYERKQFDQAAEQFKRYLAQAPADHSAAIDYASVLADLRRYAEAATVLESVHQAQPQNEAAHFKLALIYLNLQRAEDARKTFAALESSTNADMAAAARDALARLREESMRADRQTAEEHVYQLARDLKHEEVVREVEKLESAGELSWGMEMQRLYSLVSLNRYAAALEYANRLEQRDPRAPDLALVRADLYARLGQLQTAEQLWHKVESEHPGTAAAAEAARRLAEKAPPPSREERVYVLARQSKHREVVEAIAELERQEPLSPAMELQRLYAWLALGQTQLALERFDKVAQQHPSKPELALLHADLLMQQHRWSEASRVLKELQRAHPDTFLAAEAERRLASPEIVNFDKFFWGEAYLSGDYQGRYGTLIGSGFARHGYYIPEARWLQPYAEFRFSVDTRSGAGRRSTIITDNFIGFYGGMRAQLVPGEYLFIYGQGGGNKDFLDRRENGDWALDYQAGIYGFKSWGPGTILRRPQETVATAGGIPPADASATHRWRGSNTNSMFWRGDWFVDAGADFSYYHRYSSWIGYGQAHQGFRLWQLGPRTAIDAYAVENLAWDVRGNFYDNFIEVGPGVRLLWTPAVLPKVSRWEVVLRAEWLNGFYFERDALDNRGDASSNYDDFRVGLSVGIRW